MFSHLNDLEAVAVDATVEDGAIPFLRLDPGAQALFNGWRESFERRLRGDDEHPAFIAHLAKYRKLVPVLALVTHLAERGCGAIGERTMLRALAWSEYLESHARRAYASVTQAEMSGARALLNRLRKNALPNPFTVRDIYFKGWANLSTPESARRAAQLLAELDYVQAQEVETGGRPKTLYVVNPKALQS